jgi:S-adenosylhomocysteine hydrolase
MATTAPKHDVRDLALAPGGVTRIEWADRQMPVLASIRERFEREKPLEGYRISACLHVTTETANLARTLKAGGADVLLCASNPLSTQDDVAAALVAEFGVPVFAIKGEDDDTYYSHITAGVDHHPHMTMDDGADVIGVLHSKRPEQLGEIIGGTEETTTGVIRLRALEALMDGFEVLSADQAAEVGDIFCTATGDKHVLARRHFERMKDGAILANTGHFNVEIEIPALQDMATETRVARPFVEEFMLADGRRIYLVADGRLVNLGAAEGHPASVMDMSFANQALSAEFVVEHADELEPKVYVVPEEIDREIARLKLEAEGVEIDTLTEEQAKYLASWDEGT